MAEGKKKTKIKWKRFFSRTWNKGLKSGLEEIVNATTTQFDNMGLKAADALVKILLKEKTPAELPTELEDPQGEGI